MQDFPSNSNKAEPREKLEAITSAETVRRKRGLGRQFKETFFAGSGRDAMHYMAEEVVLPAIRDTIYDAVQSGFERLIYGERIGRPRTTSRPPWMGQNAGHVNYSGMSTSAARPQPQQRMLSRQSRARHSFDELVIPSRQEAEEVIDRMYDVLAKYGEVNVGHLYALTGIQASHTDEKWGWTNLKGAKAVRLRQGGYLLDLPAPEELHR